jgi:uncharacterized protein (TIGR02246 family)
MHLPTRPHSPKCWPATALAALACLAAPAAAQVTSGPDEDIAAIASLIKAVEAANNAGDVEAWVALFTEDAVYMPPGVPAVTTRPELVEIARAGFVHDAAIDIEALEIHVMGDWAFARTRVGGTVTLDGSGDVITIDVKQIAIYRREAAGWRIARLINNANG